MTNTDDSLGARLRHRKLVQWAVAYAAGAWLLLQVLSLIAQPFAWPDLVMRAAIVVLGVGFFAVLVLAWFHGEKGQQRASGTELVMLASLCVIAATGVLLVSRTGAQQDATAAFVAVGDDAVEPGSIAVLPFDDLSQAADQGYFADGITEEILNVLARIDGLRVIARTSSFQFRGETIDVRDIGHRLGVANVLQGSVRRSGERVRISAQLVDARQGYQLWSDEWESELGDVFAIEDLIAGGVAAALTRHFSVTLSAVGQRPSVEAAAHDLYLRGLALATTGEEASMYRAVALFREAIEVDPDYAAPHAGVALAYGVLADAYVAPREAYEVVRSAAERALVLDPDNGTAQVTLAYAMFILERRAADMLSAMRRITRDHPNSVEVAYIASVLICGFDADEALALIHRAQRIDPYSYMVRWSEEVCLAGAGRYDDVLRVHPDLIALAPNAAYLDDMAAVAWRGKGQPERALAEYEHLAPGLPRTTGTAFTYLQQGRTEEARGLVDELEAEAARRYLPPSILAALHSGLGDHDAAARWLERADEQGDLIAWFLKTIPDYRRLLDNPATAVRLTGMVEE